MVREGLAGKGTCRQGPIGSGGISPAGHRGKNVPAEGVMAQRYPGGSLRDSKACEAGAGAGGASGRRAVREMAYGLVDFYSE